jgi:hypothetical protein
MAMELVFFCFLVAHNRSFINPSALVSAWVHF